MQVLRCLLPVLFCTIGSLGAVQPKSSKSASAGEKPPNIILITLDTTRADRMGFLGSKRELTPNLDALAKHCVVFTRAYAQVPLTTPSHAVLLTGTYPQFNHVVNLGEPLMPQVPYLPDLLHHHGYHTAAFVGSMVLDPASKAAPGFDRGFDMYDAGFHNSKPGEDRYKSLERRAEDVANRAMGWLSHNRQGPFFMWLHFYDAHEPYDPPEPFRAQYAAAPYDGEIAYTDSVVGSILEVLQRHGLYQNTAIVVTADHGEAFGEHGEKYHGIFLYDETIHVPLLLKLPAEKFAGTQVDSHVALADIAPSLLQLAKAPIPAAMQGQSLLPVSSGPSQSIRPADRAIYSESEYAHRAFGWSELQSWRVQKYLFIQAPKRELYDESADSNASKNLAGTAVAVTDTLASQLSDFRKKTEDSAVVRSEVDPAGAENLRALGYLVSDNLGSKPDERSLIDPKDKIDFANKLHDFLADVEADRFEKASAALNSLVQEYPNDTGTANLEYGRALVHREQYQEALPALHIAAEKMPNSSMAHYELGFALAKLKEWEAALPEVQMAVKLKPSSAQLHFDLATVELHLKQVEQAIEEYEKTLKLDPSHFQANLTYGRLLIVEGHPESALDKLKRAVEIDPESAEAHGFLAVAYKKLGQFQAAERERAKAVELKDQSPPPQ